jgi:membrane-associated phospholipid phosphatase
MWKLHEHYVSSLYFLALALIVVIDFFIEKPLYDASIPFIQDLQTNMSKSVINFYVTLSFLGAGIIYFLVFLLIFNWGTRARAFYYLTYLCTDLWIMNVTKMGYHDPRPYMSDDKILPYDCSHEYGNPSGHSIFAMGFFVFLFLDVYHKKHESFA